MMGRRVVLISHQMLEQILLGVAARFDAKYRTTTNVPRDMRVVGIVQGGEDIGSDRSRIVCESAEWDRAPEGMPLPEFSLEMTNHP